MTKLSPAAQAAQAVLTEITQQEYCLDPADIPLEACRMAYIASAALRAAADQVVPDEPHPELSQFWDDEADREWQNNQQIRRQLLAIAAELEADR